MLSIVSVQGNRHILTFNLEAIATALQHNLTKRHDEINKQLGRLASGMAFCDEQWGTIKAQSTGMPCSHGDDGGAGTWDSLHKILDSRENTPTVVPKTVACTGPQRNPIEHDC